MQNLIGERNKEYTVELEVKIERLEAEIVSLKNKIIRHKQECKSFNARVDFEQNNEYSKTGLISDLRNSIIDVGNRFKYFSEIVGPASFERQKLIKQAINTVIDNVLPDPMKWMTYLIEQGTNANEKDYNKLLSLPLYSAWNELKNPKYGEIDHALYNAGVDAPTRNKMLSLSPKIIEFRQSIRKLIHDQVRLRNKLLNIQNGFDIGKLLLSSYISPFSLSKVLEYWNKIDQSQFSRFTIWGIKKKSLFVEENEDSVRLTESEEI